MICSASALTTMPGLRVAKTYWRVPRSERRRSTTDPYRHVATKSPLNTSARHPGLGAGQLSYDVLPDGPARASTFAERGHDGYPYGWSTTCPKQAAQTRHRQSPDHGPGRRPGHVRTGTIDSRECSPAAMAATKRSPAGSASTNSASIGSEFAAASSTIVDAQQALSAVACSSSIRPVCSSSAPSTTTVRGWSGLVAIPLRNRRSTLAWR
jgi:hypothetical protein